MGDLVWVKICFAQTLIEYFPWHITVYVFSSIRHERYFFNSGSAPKANRTKIDININLVKILVWANKIVAVVVKTSNHFCPPFWIFPKKSWPSSPAACILCPAFLRQEWAGIRLLFHRKVINCPPIHCEIWIKGQVKHQKLLWYIRIDRKLEIAQNAISPKSWAKPKNLLEIREVAKKLPSNCWNPRLDCLGEKSRVTWSSFSSWKVNNFKVFQTLVV